MNLGTEIKLMTEHLAEDEQSELMVCPKCSGGASEEKSFTARKTASGVAFICYRASCGFKGLVKAKGSGLLRYKEPKPKEPKPFTGDRSPLPDYAKSFLASKFPMGIDFFLERGVKYSHFKNRVLYPINNFRGERYGWVARWYPFVNTTTSAKSILYRDTDDVLHFATRPAERMVIVEDWVSAERVGEVVPCVAVLGADLSAQSVELLKSLGVKELTLCLDPDAIAKAVEIKDRLCLEFTITVLPVKTDPKDMTPEEFKLFEEI